MQIHHLAYITGTLFDRQMADIIATIAAYCIRQRAAKLAIVIQLLFDTFDCTKACHKLRNYTINMAHQYCLICVWTSLEFHNNICYDYATLHRVLSPAASGRYTHKSTLNSVNDWQHRRQSQHLLSRDGDETRWGTSFSKGHIKLFNFKITTKLSTPCTIRSTHHVLPILSFYGKKQFRRIPH